MTEEQIQKRIEEAIAKERAQCADFAYAKYDWPPRWIAASFRGENSAYTNFIGEPAPSVME